MPIVDTSVLPMKERLPGWKGRYFHTEHLTVAHYEFSQGAVIHEHYHPEEELYEMIEGELEIIVDGEVYVARPGIAVVVPSNARHKVTARTDGKLIVVDHPARPEFG